MYARLLLAIRPARKHKPPSRQSRAFIANLEVLEARDAPEHPLVSGWRGPQGSTIGPDGDLYVTEAVAGRVSRVDPQTGAVTPFATGLPISPFAGFGGGAVDVAFIGGTAYVLL